MCIFAYHFCTMSFFLLFSLTHVILMMVVVDVVGTQGRCNWCIDVLMTTRAAAARAKSKGDGRSSEWSDDGTPRYGEGKRSGGGVTGGASSSSSSSRTIITRKRSSALSLTEEDTDESLAGTINNSKSDDDHHNLQQQQEKKQRGSDIGDESSSEEEVSDDEPDDDRFDDGDDGDEDEKGGVPVADEKVSIKSKKKREGKELKNEPIINHEHELLWFGLNDMGYRCDVCQEVMEQHAWMCSSNDKCSFGVHDECIGLTRAGSCRLVIPSEGELDWTRELTRVPQLTFASHDNDRLQLIERTPIGLFHRFITSALIDRLVEATNNYALRPERETQLKQRGKTPVRPLSLTPSSTPTTTLHAVIFAIFSSHPPCSSFHFLQQQSKRSE